jgi:hypothetical protein
MTLVVALACGLVTIPFTTLATRAVLLRLPADHFVRARPSWRERWRGSFWRKLAMVARNGVGTSLIIAGGIMSIPGVPGPGLLTVLLGLYLVEFPVKHRLQSKVLQSRHLRTTVNRLRARSGRPGLQFPPPNQDAGC